MRASSAPLWLCRITTLLTLVLFAASCASEPAPASAARPNAIIILADDMGFSDAGCYGSEIATPNLDALAQDGVRFTRFYNTARCWPTRATILAGHYAQSVRRDIIPGVKHCALSNRPAWAVLLPQMLQLLHHAQPPLHFRHYPRLLGQRGKWDWPISQFCQANERLRSALRYFENQLLTE